MQSNPVFNQDGLRVRSATLRAVREFFAARDFVEVETPVRIPTPALELHIDAVRSERNFLRTSPELHMKRLLSAGERRIWQMGPCFRAGERGARHNTEFTMLEWYRADADYSDILADARALLLHVTRAVTGGTAIRYGNTTVDLLPDWTVLSVRQAYRDYAGWDPWNRFDADRFDLDMVQAVEPRLPPDRPAVLMDYPAEAAALARRKPADPTTAERWELYVGGMELANAFSELTDAREQRARFVACANERARLGKSVYPLDEAFLAALERGMPESGGAALGVDRLVMLLTGATDIAAVRPFCREAD